METVTIITRKNLTRLIFILPFLHWVIVYLAALSYYNDAPFHYRTASLYHEFGDITEYTEQKELGNECIKKGNGVLLYLPKSFRPPIKDTLK